MSVAFQREYVDLLGGDVQAALVLSQLRYWYTPGTSGPRLRVERDGCYWLAKSVVDWTTETGLSSMRVRRCLSVLRDKGLIVTKVYKFNGAPVVHVRLLVAEGRSSLPVNKSICCPDQLQMMPTSIANDAQIKSLTESTSESTSEIKTAAPFGVEVDEVPYKNSTVQQVQNGEVQQVKASEVLALHKGHAQNAQNAETAWKSLLSGVHGGTMQYLTAKDRGMIGLLKKHMGPQVVPYFTWVVGNWHTFLTLVEYETGVVDKPPHVPQLGYLLRYWSVAQRGYLGVNMDAHASAAAAANCIRTVVGVRVGVQSIAVQPIAVQQHTPTPTPTPTPTKQETLAAQAAQFETYMADLKAQAAAQAPMPMPTPTPTPTPTQMTTKAGG